MVERLRVKICGLREPENIREVCALLPDYIGFILTSLSPRVVDVAVVEDFIQSGAVPAAIKKIGVFVNPTIEEVVEVSRRLNLDGIQLHGEESLSFCAQVRTLHPEGLLFKAFGIGSIGDLDNIENYSSLVDAFIFDTKSPQRGGTGQTFDWSILRDYKGLKPFFLSGGIGPETISEARVVCQQLGAYGVDCSSLCEVSPGRKDLAKIRQVIDEVRRT